MIIHPNKCIKWRRKWQPTPLLLPGKSYGQRSLVGYSPGGCRELDMIEHTHRCINASEHRCSLHLERRFTRLCKVRKSSPEEVTWGAEGFKLSSTGPKVRERAKYLRRTEGLPGGLVHRT